MDVWDGLWRRLSTEELMLLNCVLEKTLESPLDCKEIQPVHSEGDQSWVFFGRTDANAETPVLWLPHAKSWLIRKDFDAGRDWGQKEKRTTEDEMAGCYRQLNGCESEWTLGVAWWTGRPGVLWFMGSRSQTGLSNWTELNAKRYTECSLKNFRKPNHSHLVPLLPKFFLGTCSCHSMWQSSVDRRPEEAWES